MSPSAAEFLNTLAIYLVPVLFAITVHEAAHAYAAKLMGDQTAYRLGRATLNPTSHIDPVGTVLVPMACLLMGGFLFGWAKPVPINPSLMRYPKKSPFWVALAGPMSNFVMALMWALAALAAHKGWVGQWAGAPLSAMGMAGVQINLMLMILNLFPFPPLDGARMVERFLKGKPLAFWQRAEGYGIWVVLGLSFIGVLNIIWFSPWLKAFSWVKDLAIPSLPG